LNKLEVWILAIRPKTLPAAIASSLLGLSFALNKGKINIFAAISAVLISILLQIGSNLANDLFDFQRGVDTSERIGPTRVTQAGLLSLYEMKIGLVVVFSLASILGFYLAIIAGWIVIIIGISAILAALLYSGGPFPYGYHFLGEVFVFIYFGVVAVCGTYYVLTGEVTRQVLFSSFCMGFLISNILIINNLRDIKTDKLSGKQTMAVYLGKKRSRIEYVIFLIITYIFTLIIVLIDPEMNFILLTWLTIPLSIILSIKLFRSDGTALNSLLSQTAQLAFIFSIVFSIGVLV